MLTRPEVIQVKESVFHRPATRIPILFDPYPSKTYYQRLGQYLVGIDASAGYVYGSALCMGAGLLLRGLDAMVRATIA